MLSASPATRLNKCQIRLVSAVFFQDGRKWIVYGENGFWEEMMFFNPDTETAPTGWWCHRSMCIYFYLYSAHVYIWPQCLHHKVLTQLRPVQSLFRVVNNDYRPYEQCILCSEGVPVLIPTDSLWHWELLETCHGNGQPDRSKVKINDPQPNV